VVQALAFAEIFLGLIILDAGYKGVSIPRVIKGEAGKGVEPAPLGSSPSSASTTGSTPGETVPSRLAPTPQEAAKGAAFGPGPTAGNAPPIGGFGYTPISEAEAIANGELLPPARTGRRGLGK
jgi:hypothetical protein